MMWAEAPATESKATGGELMSDVTSLRADCEACAQTVTATVVDGTIPADVAEFFRAHAAHAVSPPRNGTRTGTGPDAAPGPGRRTRFSRRGPRIS
jgi:hypothetical protein